LLCRAMEAGGSAITQHYFFKMCVSTLVNNKFGVWLVKVWVALEHSTMLSTNRTREDLSGDLS
jgi:hypothetical protein